MIIGKGDELHWEMIGSGIPNNSRWVLSIKHAFPSFVKSYFRTNLIEVRCMDGIDYVLCFYPPYTLFEIYKQMYPKIEVFSSFDDAKIRSDEFIIKFQKLKAFL